MQRGRYIFETMPTELITLQHEVKKNHPVLQKQWDDSNGDFIVKLKKLSDYVGKEFPRIGRYVDYENFAIDILLPALQAKKSQIR